MHMCVVTGVTLGELKTYVDVCSPNTNSTLLVLPMHLLRLYFYFFPLYLEVETLGLWYNRLI
jgi:hypothetical protein